MKADLDCMGGAGLETANDLDFMFIGRPEPRVDILVGDTRAVLPTLAADSVHCCVTSPPYFGLRDYGVDGQIGLEQTPDQFVAQIVEVFRKVRRVLRPDGTLWLNLGDSYSNGGRATRAPDARNCAREMATRPADGLKPKDLIGIPWRVAFALQADGWYLRSSIIWHKPNPMPESVTDRPTNAHENLFLFAKSERYYYDAEAVREPAVSLDPSHSSYRPNSARIAVEGRKEYKAKHAMSARAYNPLGRNMRNVWTVTTRPFKGAHFATFPPALVEPCIKAGCPVGGTVLDPFGGAGTTALVARELGRSATLVELNPAYAQLARERLGL